MKEVAVKILKGLDTSKEEWTMKLNETTLSFLEVDCIQQFGKEKGNLIFEQVEKIFQELLNNATIVTMPQFKIICKQSYFQH